jgi:lipoprotein-anchoring transpeptidase ErfK/SrfK
MSPAILPIVLALTAAFLSAPVAAEGRVATITPPRTLELVTTAKARHAPEGFPAARWDAGTLITSDRARGDWVRVTGHFPDGRWRPARKPLWLPEGAVVSVRPTAPKRPLVRRIEARTFQVETALRLRDGPQGHPLTEWQPGTRFTVRRRQGDWLAVSGHFPEGRWVPLETEAWVPADAVRDISPPPAIPLPEAAERFAVVDKSDFELRVVQRAHGEREVVYRTEVGLGMDGCLPEAHGGNCYYTETGTYRVRWRIYRPDGIDWCIPDSMAAEPEYAADLARGQRCFEGALGKFALNIGKTYAIHGTRDLDSLGKRESHGCIRARPDDVRRVWRYLREGDRVVIRE